MLGKVRESNLRNEHVEKLVRLTNEELQASVEHIKKRVENIETQLAEVDGRLARLYDALETGRLSLDDLAPRIKELREKRDLMVRARVEAQETFLTGRVELVSREVVLDYINDLRRVLDISTVSEQRAFLRSFIQAVER